MIGNVKNPTAARENLKIGVLTYDFNGNNGSRTYLNYELFNMFINTKSTSPINSISTNLYGGNYKI